MDRAWSTLGAWWRVAGEYASSAGKFTEEHAGLGAWVSAFLAAATIIIMVWLSVADRGRAQKHELEGFNSQIDLFARIASELRPFVQKYVALAEANDPLANTYYGERLNEGILRRAGDLNGIPVTQWPSVEAYDAYKAYFRASTRLLETPRGRSTGTSFDDRKRDFDATYEVLVDKLTAARR